MEAQSKSENECEGIKLIKSIQLETLQAPSVFFVCRDDNHHGSSMRASNALGLRVLASLALVLVALHSPGEMSVDSLMSLYEAQKGAQGWGPAFMSAALAWLGGGTIGTSLFVSLNCLLTYGFFAVLLINGRRAGLSRWQTATAFLLSLNPLFMFYVGIMWKHVTLATVAMVAATLLLLAADRSGRSRAVIRI